MKKGRQISGLLLCFVIAQGQAFGALSENAPGPFVTKDADERLSPDGRVEVRFVDPTSSTRQLQFIERSSGRVIWSSPSYNIVTDVFQTARSMRAFFSPNSKTAVARHTGVEADDDPRAKFFFVDLVSGSTLRVYDWLYYHSLRVSFSPDGRHVMVEDVVDSRTAPSNVEFAGLESGGPLLFQTQFAWPAEGLVAAQVNADRRTATGVVGSRSFSFNLPNTPPAISITAPASGTRVARGQAVTVSTFATDNVGLTQVSFRAAGGGLDFSDLRSFATVTPVNPAFSFTVPADALFDAIITLTVTATDGADFQATATSTVQVEAAPPPSISQVQPNSGPVAGGTTVIVQGANFQPGATVTFGGRSATNVIVTSPGAVFAVTPAGSQAGLTNVTVTNPDGRSATLFNGFTYVSYPAVNVTITQLDVSGFPTIRGFVKVLDAALKPITNLTAGNFVITENGTTQSPITIQAQGGGEPVAVAIAIDNSSSIDDAELASVTAAATSFVDLLKPADRACVIKFTSAVVVAQACTTDKTAVKAAIAGPRAPSNGTAVYDAVIKAADLLAAELPRRALVVLTDGQDNSSSQTLQAAINRANAYSAPVFPLALGDDLDANGLNQLALGTGGQLSIAPSTAQLQALFAVISGAIETQYKFTYAASNSAKDGTTRLVMVRVTIGANSGTAQKSYQAPLVLQPPTATIQSITPNPARSGQLVTFQGAGSDSDGTVTAYEWSSNLSGILSTQASFTSSTLAVGDHTITFRVRDNANQWSAPVTRQLTISSAPSLDTQLGPNRHDPENTAVGEPVNVVTGNMYMTVEDLAIPGVGMPLRFTRTYNSQSQEDGPMGFGWTNIFLIGIKQVGPDRVGIRTETGAMLYFTKDGSGTWIAPPGEHSTLVQASWGDWTWTLKSGLNYTFFSTGGWFRTSDTNGNTMRFGSGESGWSGQFFLVKTPRDTANRLYQLSYTAGRLTQLTDPSSRIFRYAYDAQGNLISVMDPAGRVTRYEYTDPLDSHNLTRMVDANGYATRWVYDTQDRAIETSNDGNKRRLQLSYDPIGRRTTITDSLGRQTVKEYNDQGLIVRETDPLANVTSSTWDAQLNRTSMTNALGRTTTMSYDSRGNLTEVTDPLGNVTTFEYASPFSRLTKLADAQGHVASYSYDAKGNLLRVTDPLNQATAYTYDAKGQVLSVADPKGSQTSYTYDSQGNLASVIDPLGKWTTFTYDSRGNRTAITDSSSHITRFEYDSLNRITKAISPDGSFTTFAYDAVGNRTAVTDPLGQITQSRYDEVNQLIQTIDPLGNMTSYAYDTEGNLLSLTDARGNATRYTYDALNRVTSVTNPLSFVTAFQYDAVGNRTAVTDAEGKTVRSTYDNLNRLTKIELPDGRMIQSVYDVLGRRMSVSGPDGSAPTTFDYDALGRLLAADGPGANDTIAYAYDAVGNRLSMTDPDGRLTRYAYDPLNRITQIADPANRLFRYSYDTDGNFTQLTYPNSSTANLSYDVNHRLLSLANRASTGTAFASVAYSYDPAGRRTQAQFLDAVATYGYDAANRLISETRTGTSPYAISYTYDRGGNRLDQLRDGITTTYGYNQANQLLRQSRLGRLEGRTITVAGTTDPNATVVVNGVQATVYPDGRWVATGVPLTPGAPVVTVTATDPAGNVTQYQLGVTLDPEAEALYRYDKNGNLIERTENGQQTQFSWDALGHLTQITQADGVRTVFAYDADGRRISVGQPGRASTSDFFYDGLNVIQQGKAGLDSAGNRIPSQAFTWGPSLGGGIGGLLAQVLPKVSCGFGGCFVTGDTPTYTYFDGSGNMVAWDINGNQVYQRLGYEAFGSSFSLSGLDLRPGQTTSTAIPVTGSVAFPYQFSTKRPTFLDEAGATRLYDFGARWYDPTIGRFLSPDPAGFGDGVNLYAYVGNNPVNFIDPVGLAGVPLALTDVKKLAELGNALDMQRGGVRLRIVTRVNGRQYIANTGRGGAFPLASAARRLDNPAIAKYINPASAAKGAAWGSGGGLTAILVTTQDVLAQLRAGGSLTDSGFLGHTGLDVGKGLASGAAGAAAGAVVTGWTLNPAAGIVTGVAVSSSVGAGLDALERWTVDMMTVRQEN